MVPSVSRKLFEDIPRRVYKTIVRYHSFPYEADTMLPVIDTPISSSEWAELVIDPRGKARLFVAKDKELDDLFLIGVKARKRLHELLDEGKTKPIETTAIMDRAFQQRRVLEGKSTENRDNNKLIYDVKENIKKIYSKINN